MTISSISGEGGDRAREMIEGIAADPEIGYKDDGAVKDWLRQAGARRVEQREMPANNLTFIAWR